MGTSQKKCFSLCVVVFLSLCCGPGMAADYLKLIPPPDANKPYTASDASCWLATAANVLAGAGYGTGATVQVRADEIYNELKANLSTTG